MVWPVYVMELWYSASLLQEKIRKYVKLGKNAENMQIKKDTYIVELYC